MVLDNAAARGHWSYVSTAVLENPKPPLLQGRVEKLMNPTLKHLNALKLLIESAADKEFLLEKLEEARESASELWKDLDLILSSARIGIRKMNSGDFEGGKRWLENVVKVFDKSEDFGIVVKPTGGD